MKISVVLAVAAMAVGPVTCSNCSGGSKETVLTYNAGMTTTVLGYDTRRYAVVDAIEGQASETDFMCLQEAWFEEDVKNVLDRLQNNFPYHYSAIHNSVGNLRADSGSKSWFFPGWSTMACSLWKIVKLGACVTLKCGHSLHDQKCMVENCGDHLYGLSQDCRSCVSASSSSVSDVVGKCTSAVMEYNRMNRPGLLILSRRPLTDVQYVQFHPGRKVLLERGYIKATTADGMTKVCTHLSARLPYYFEAKLTEFTSFKEMQRNEILQLNRTFGGTRHVLMGDLNTGIVRNEIGLPVLNGEFAENYELLSNLLYQNAYMQNDGRCTFCSSENPVLKAQGKQYGDIAIDHVLTSPGVTADVNSSQRVLDDLSQMLSDHFGIQQDICMS
ncbi:hypothetical protein ACOMHN_013162 [Nucella lapillus]